MAEVLQFTTQRLSRAEQIVEKIKALSFDGFAAFDSDGGIYEVELERGAQAINSHILTVRETLGGQTVFRATIVKDGAIIGKKKVTLSEVFKQASVAVKEHLDETLLNFGGGGF